MIDLSSAALFPQVPDAASNPKCRIIEKVMQEMARYTDLTPYTPQEIQADAAKRYAFLCEEGRISPLEAKALIHLLNKRGVLVSTAEEYVAFRKPPPSLNL